MAGAVCGRAHRLVFFVSPSTSVTEVRSVSPPASPSSWSCETSSNSSMPAYARQESARRREPTLPKDSAHLAEVLGRSGCRRAILVTRSRSSSSWSDWPDFRVFAMYLSGGGERERLSSLGRFRPCRRLEEVNTSQLIAELKATKRSRSRHALEPDCAAEAGRVRPGPRQGGGGPSHPRIAALGAELRVPSSGMRLRRSDQGSVVMPCGIKRRRRGGRGRAKFIRWAACAAAAAVCAVRVVRRAAVV